MLANWWQPGGAGGGRALSTSEGKAAAEAVANMEGFLSGSLTPNAQAGVEGKRQGDIQWDGQDIQCDGQDIQWDTMGTRSMRPAGMDAPR